jgi:aspartate/glutamate racemase
MKSIGIISGAGPYAGIVLHQKIIKICNDSGCKKDVEFPLIKHISYPFASTDINGVVDFILSQKELSKAIQMCNEVDQIALACNSLLPSLNEINKVLVFDPRTILKKMYIDQPVIVLASVSSVQSGLYDDITNDIIYPDKHMQEKVNKIIDEVMQGNINQKLFDDLISEVKKNKPDILILLGCTELCVFKDEKSTINILDIIAKNMI